MTEKRLRRILRRPEVAKVLRGAEDEPEATSAATQAPCPHRLSWAKLLARVFDIAVSQYPAWGGRVKINAALTGPHAIRQNQQGVGLPARPPPIAPPRASPQPELEFAA